MSIIHITAPLAVPSEQFTPAGAAPAVGDAPTVTLFNKEVFGAPDGSVKTGIWEATPGRFARAVIDAEFSQFLAGHATFTTEHGTSFEFRAGDAAYFPPHTRGVWTIHERLRKTYVVWR